jgi:Lrp/AsnC family transcriptional regulator for asnA, asnC and gidA
MLEKALFVLPKGENSSSPMKEKTLDSLDKRLIQILTKDGRLPVGRIAKLLGITPPTVRSRLESLASTGVMRICGLVDAFRAKELTVALVGICLETHKELDQKIEQISGLNNIHWAAVVTGRFDIIVEIVTSDGMLGLYRFLTEDLPRVGGIRSSESFMVMKAKRKWVLVPSKVMENTP